jgi:cytochrome c biogenesis protein CcmG, thiol:disulfide interchange protein DsbE
VSRRLLAALGAGLVLLAGCTSGAGGEPEERASRQDVGDVRTDLRPCPAQTDRPAADDALPDLRLPCFSGGTLDLGKAPGVPMVVNFWASWCPPCREELPLVQQLADAGGDRVRVVGLVSKDGMSQATSFAADAHATFPAAFDGDGDVMTELGIRNLPYTYFITADGRIAHVQIGQITSLDEAQQLVAQYLGVQL